MLLVPARRRLTQAFLAVTQAFLAIAMGCIAATSAQAETVIAFWDFNDGFGVTDEVPQIIHTASIGSGTIYQQRADTDGNGKGGVDFVNGTFGINVVGDRAIAWDDIAKSGGNDAELFAEFSTLGFTSIQVRFDIRGNFDAQANSGTIIQTYDIKYDNNGLVDIVNPPDVTGTIKDFAGGLSTTFESNRTINLEDSYITQSLDFTGLTSLENQSVVAIRLDDFVRDGNDAMRIDNFLVTGTAAIPEPSTASLLTLMAGGLAMRRRRRRRV